MHYYEHSLALVAYHNSYNLKVWFGPEWVESSFSLTSTQLKRL